MSAKLPFLVSFVFVSSQGVQKRTNKLFERGDPLYIFANNEIQPLRVLPVSVIDSLAIWAALVEIGLQGLPYLVMVVELAFT